MTRPMLERLEIENYGCIKKAEFKLSPLHALIGPNDSGKSTVLRALRTLATLAHPNGGERDTQEARSLITALHANAGEGHVTLAVQSGGTTWRVQVLRETQLFEKTYPGAVDSGETGNSQRIDFPSGTTVLRSDAVLARSLSGAQVLRLEPDVLRMPGGLIPDGDPLRFADERGAGLPGVYDAILTRDLTSFSRINEQLRLLFPSIRQLSLKNISSGQKALGVQLADGRQVSAEYMSEGLLYYLAFAALAHLEQTALILIEEPENGLHPARIADVMRVLREISKNTQVVIATHSPLVVNELTGDEVSVVTRSAEAGTQVRLLKDTADFEERSKIYSPGELWLSYADGKEEAALLTGGPRP